MASTSRRGSTFKTNPLFFHCEIMFHVSCDTGNMPNVSASRQQAYQQNRYLQKLTPAARAKALAAQQMRKDTPLRAHRKNASERAKYQRLKVAAASAHKQAAHSHMETQTLADSEVDDNEMKAECSRHGSCCIRKFFAAPAAAHKQAAHSHMATQTLAEADDVATQTLAEVDGNEMEVECSGWTRKFCAAWWSKLLWWTITWTTVTEGGTVVNGMSTTRASAGSSAPSARGPTDSASGQDLHCKVTRAPGHWETPQP